MLGLMLKWLTIALVMLTAFSAATALYSFYVLKLGSCADGCAEARSWTALTYVGVLGLFGFSISAIAAHVIGKSFRRTGD
ncbi:MAG: hypothetical protein QNI84_14965 [Henriciella sp.]|nr:hypothetical protein [Henriciella sp.]